MSSMPFTMADSSGHTCCAWITLETGVFVQACAESLPVTEMPPIKISKATFEEREGSSSVGYQEFGRCEF